MSLPIRARLTLWYVSLLAVILAALGGFVVLRLRADLIRGVDVGLDIRAAQIALGLENGCEGEFQDVATQSFARLPQLSFGAQLLGPSGKVRESAGNLPAGRPLISAEMVDRAFSGARVRVSLPAGAGGEPLRILAVRLPAGSCRGVVVVSTSLGSVESSVRRLVVLLTLAVPAALAAAGAGGWWLARRALAPVAQMTREAQELGVARLGERIEVPRTKDELRRLASTLNDMLDRLERGVEAKRRFVADASHELRTPLAAMRAEVEVSLRSPGLDRGAREVLLSAEEELERMQRIVENLLTLARIDEGGLELLREPVAFRDAVGSSVGSLGSLASVKSVQVSADVADIVVEADRARLEQVLVNLVGNAIKFSAPGDDVLVVVRHEGPDAVCSVTDRGPGIEASLLPRVFDRFVRGDPARSNAGGSGLGLAICREIVVAHGGRIWVVSRVGQGSTFSFTIPAGPPIPDEAVPEAVAASSDLRP